MAHRYTMADLNGAVRGLNRIAGFSEEEADAPLCTRGEDGQNRAMVGRYTLQGAYGGYQLTQITNEGGGVRSLTGYGTKREVYHLIQAYREGMAAGRGDDHYTLAAIRARVPEYRAERAAYAARVEEVAR